MFKKLFGFNLMGGSAIGDSTDSHSLIYQCEGDVSGISAIVNMKEDKEGKYCLYIPELQKAYQLGIMHGKIIEFSDTFNLSYLDKLEIIFEGCGSSLNTKYGLTNVWVKPNDISNKLLIGTYCIEWKFVIDPTNTKFKTLLLYLENTITKIRKEITTKEAEQAIKKEREEEALIKLMEEAIK